MHSPEDCNGAAEQPDTAGSAKPLSIWPHVVTDYHGALVRLTTMRAAGKQYLLFGYVELFPRDIPVPERFAAREKPWAVPNVGGGVTLAASALPMSTADALAWYEAAARGRVTIPLTASPVEIAAPPFGVEPALGRFCAGDTIPFSAQWHGGPRIHRLVPMEVPAEAIQKLGSSAAAREWLAANAGFDPFEYEEWLASLCLLAPDPLLTGVGHYTHGRTAAGLERVILQTHRRHYEGFPEADAAALKLVILQRRPAGWTEVLPASFDSDGFAIKDYPEPVSETGFAIACPNRGLVRVVPPTYLINQISVGFGVVDAVLDVEVPAGGRRKPASRYLTDRVREAGEVHAGEALPRSGAIRIVELQEARKDRLQRQSAPQRLFGSHEPDKDDLMRMRCDAESYVANLVAEAQRRVIFVDPDFGVREFQNYALRVRRDGVSVTILTGALHMHRARQEDSEEETLPQEETTPPERPGNLLLAQLQRVQGQLGPGAPQVFVMSGRRKPVFHDRFLVIDDVVWASGPSFNELGERFGLISRVHEPRVVVAAIVKALDGSMSLADWVADEIPPEPNREVPDATNI
jgi:hypothetical protein